MNIFYLKWLRKCQFNHWMPSHLSSLSEFRTPVPPPCGINSQCTLSPHPVKKWCPPRCFLSFLWKSLYTAINETNRTICWFLALARIGKQMWAPAIRNHPAPSKCHVISWTQWFVFVFVFKSIRRPTPGSNSQAQSPRVTRSINRALWFFFLPVSIVPIFYSSNLYLIFLSPLLNPPRSLRPATDKLHVEPTFRLLGQVEKRKGNPYAGKADESNSQCLPRNRAKKAMESAW